MYRVNGPDSPGEIPALRDACRGRHVLFSWTVEAPSGGGSGWELLEDELQQLRDQADFTEKLLTERSGPPPGEALEAKPPTE